ncbi:hypothetical protein C6A86_028100 [Mycobacterium sp. ITM-2016-00316]|uniref:hypothetical protein n=1 Tax=Mycobacterium sp. ITM-2016-00316 TaxID=2099695 RepID=UPI000CF87D0F|nr:hypothetical protein [Mycobacterium sp. ITM-2016-00316]WNG81957.1 hypothetical protein C6A86_028100 [Mycobacterium sp. ITM-2016-00316]
MDVIYWGVAIVGCVALAACIAAALLPPRRDQPERLRALANTTRLTGLPQYARAVRRHTVIATAAVAVLALSFVAAALAAARPAGLPALNRAADTEQPEDIMVCVGAPAEDPAVNGTLRYFAEAVRGFGTERVGLTSPDRRLIPLTRDYQYAAGRFAGYAQPQPLVSSVAYTDYTATIEDVLAMCLTGFPEFDTEAPVRRSLIYVGPGTLGGDGGPSLFTAQQVRDMVATAGVQVNAVSDDDGLPAELARQTGGRVTADVGDIRSHPPAPQPGTDDASVQSPETPDLLLIVALLGVATMLAWPLVVRR